MTIQARITDTCASVANALLTVPGVLVATGIALLAISPAAAEDHQSEENPFMVDIDYTDTVSFGGKRLYRLKQNSEPKIEYVCKTGKIESANIAKVEHDEKCERIIVTAAAGPFVDDSGAVLQRGFVNNKPGPDGYGVPSDLIPLSVLTPAGEEIFKTSFALRASNTSMQFLLSGMERPRNSEPSQYNDARFVVEPGKTYRFEVLTPDGMPLSPDFSCARSDMFSQHNDKNVSVESGCKIVLTNAQPGGLRVGLERRGSPAYSDTLMFELVTADWQPVVTNDLAPEQKVTEFTRHLTRIDKAIELRNLDKTKGEPYAQDDWYLNYLKQIEAELRSRLASAGK